MPLETTRVAKTKDGQVLVLLGRVWLLFPSTGELAMWRAQVDIAVERFLGEDEADRPTMEVPA